MADLRTCYFCGAGPDGSLDSYGVVPSALSPSADEQRSVVLCPDCRDKLTAVLETVADVATDDAGASSGPDRSTAAGGTAGTDPAVTPDGPDGTDHDAPTSSDATADDPGGAAPDESDGADDPGGTDDAGVAFSAGDEPRSGGSDGVQFGGGDAGDDAAASASGSADSSPGADDAAGSAGDLGDGDSAGDLGDDDSAGDSAEAGGSSPGEARGSSADPESPDGPAERAAKAGDPSAGRMMGDDSEAYRKVIRLLQNREFPVPREEIEDLAGNAYGLSPAECRSAVDTIVQKGLLAEEDGMLVRTS